MTINDLKNALRFLSKVHVGKSEEDRFFQTIAAIQQEIERRQKKHD